MSLDPVPKKAMAAKRYIQDLSDYLIAGNLSDLTLTFGDKTWPIHKALVCSHSKWFQKAVTIGFKEKDSGIVTLHDDAAFADAIDCMVSYFYRAGYDASKYETSKSLLHAQVAIIADKYDCASLYSLAKSLFAKSVQTVKSDDWIPIASLIYEYATTELSTHVELRKVTIAAVAEQPDLLGSIFENDSMIQLLRSNADLATDLLLAGRDKTRTTKKDLGHIFVCVKCHYAHAGSRHCSYLVSRTDPFSLFENDSSLEMCCPKCGNEAGNHATSWSSRHDYRNHLFRALPCSDCKGTHSHEPSV